MNADRRDAVVNSVRGRAIRERQVLRLGAGWTVPAVAGS